MKHETYTEEVVLEIDAAPSVVTAEAESAASTVTTANHVMETRQMSVYYGDFRAVADVSLDVAAGEMVGPAIVRIGGRSRAVGNGIAERDDRPRGVGRDDVHA